MKKLYVLVAAAFFMFITGCSGSSGDIPPSSAKAITAFKITSPIAATGIITDTETTHTIAITVPYNTDDVTALKATFTTTGASVKVGSIVQVSGTTENDFTSPVDYIVTADDSSTRVYKVTVTKSLKSGSLDPDFGTSGMVTTTIGSGNSQALALGIQSDGKIVAAGRSYNGSDYDFALARYKTDGSPDPDFGTSGKVTTPVGSGDNVANALGIQSDGKIVVAGYSYNGSNANFALARYKTDGSLDETFDADGIVTTSIGGRIDVAYALGIQPDGKIVVAGYSYIDISHYYFALVRYKTDGSLDETFDADGKVTTLIGSGYAQAYALRIQSDGKIVVAGSSYDGIDRYYFALVRYNTNGSLDETFDADGIVTTSIGTGYDQAYSLLIQSDGKIVVAGSSSNGGDYNFALVRYKTDGSPDPDFGTSGKVTTPIGIVTTTPGSGWDFAYTLGIQSDGKILAAGRSYNGSNYDFALVRYKTDGSPDPDFGTGGIVITPVGSSDDCALALGIQSDGKIVAAGYSSNGSNYDFALVRYWPSE